MQNNLLPCPARIKWRTNKIRLFRLYAGIFYLFIALIGAFKAYGFMEGWASTGEPFGVIPLLIAITYAIVAFIHIYATGYFFAEISFRSGYNRERREHMMTHRFTVPGPPCYLQTSIPLPDGLTLHGTIPHQGHYLINTDLYTFGLMEDSHISNISLVLPGTPLLKEYFLRYALHHQIVNVMSLTPVDGPPACLGPVPHPQQAQQAISSYGGSDSVSVPHIPGPSSPVLSTVDN